MLPRLKLTQVMMAQVTSKEKTVSEGGFKWQVACEGAREAPRVRCLSTLHVSFRVSDSMTAAPKH